LLLLRGRSFFVILGWIFKEVFSCLNQVFLAFCSDCYFLVWWIIKVDSKSTNLNNPQIQSKYNHCKKTLTFNQKHRNKNKAPKKQ